MLIKSVRIAENSIFLPVKRDFKDLILTDSF